MIEISETGMNVQFESYMMGYSNSVRNINQNSSSSWSPYLYNDLINEHVYNSFRTMNEYSGYKEALKRTVVEHDALFREQVSELHRLYRTQKDLMDNIKRQELYRFSYQNRISQLQLFLSPVVFHNNQNLLQHTDNIKPCIDFLKQDYIRNDSDTVNLKLKRNHRQMLDLQLPADMYIGAEDHSDMIRKEDRASLFSGVEYKSSDKMNEVDVQLTLGTREYKMNEDINGNAKNQRSSFDYAGITGNIFNSSTQNFLQVGKQMEQRKTKENNTHNIPFYDSKDIPTPDREPNPSHFDLNSPTLTNSNSHTPLSFSSCSEIASSSSPLTPSPKRKSPKTITLVPIAVQALPCFTISGNVQRKNPKKDFQKYQKKIAIDLNDEISSEGDESYDDALNALAAESLLLFSQRASPNMDLLHWFADTVLSKNSDVVADAFESLTLNLEEMKPDENIKSEQKLEIEEEKAHKGRKRREKKKDFRKEILPSIVSLSKHELKEDLHAFDCIRKAMGENLESKLTRKKLAKRKGGKLKYLETGLGVEVWKKKMLMWGGKSKRGRRLRATREFSDFSIDLC